MKTKSAERPARRENHLRNDFTHSGFFVMRTPFLPLEFLLKFSESLNAPRTEKDSSALDQVLKEDRLQIRNGLLDWISRSEIRDALFLASPELEATLDVWKSAPKSARGQRMERTLIRYLARMAGRATPFGFFAGISVGTVGSENRLELGETKDYQRHSRLDMDYLYALRAEFIQNPSVRKKLQYKPNSSLYRLSGQFRYVEQIRQDGNDRYRLVELEEDELLVQAVKASDPGISFDRLVSMLVKEFDRKSEAEDYVNEMIDRQILLPDIPLSISGSEPLESLIEHLQRHDDMANLSIVLIDTRNRLAEIDSTKRGNAAQEYRNIAKTLEALPARVDISRLFHADLVKPVVAASLSEHVLQDVLNCIQILVEIAPPHYEDPFDKFRSAFTERYGQQEVELVQALDEEIGIGYRIGNEPSELLPDLDFSVEEERFAKDARHDALLSRLGEALSLGRHTIHLTPKDLESLRAAKPPSLPGSFAAAFTLAAESPAALAQNNYSLVFRGALGPSGATMLGRFCHASAQLKDCVQKHIQDEEKLRPDAIFAEIVHLPEPRHGNIASRPSFRKYEIPYLGYSSAASEFQIPITDLLVSVRGKRIVLRSSKRGLEVIPRMTNAHNFSRGAPGMYRFLCDLQRNEARRIIRWGWGSLSSSYFLPRVQFGHYVFALAQWRMKREELASIFNMEDEQKFRAIQEWRAKRKLPRWVYVGEQDQVLLLDLENIANIDTFLSLVRDRQDFALQEVFPFEDQLCVTGPEGHFVHEMIVPFVRSKAEPAARYLSRSSGNNLQREFLPGSGWLFFKIYAAESRSEDLLCNELDHAIPKLLKLGHIKQWFFIRYEDPDRHIRLRFYSDPIILQKKVLPKMFSLFGDLQAKGKILRLQIDTYCRETERYGGPEGILLAERLFQIDSECVVSILQSLSAKGDIQSGRWHLALYGIHRYLEDFGFELSEKCNLMRHLSDSYKEEFAVDSKAKLQLAEKLRKEKGALEELLKTKYARKHPLAAELDLLNVRSKRLTPVIRAFKALDKKRILMRSLSDLCMSFIHMHVNRMMRSARREQEMVLYDFLYKLYESQLAREKSLSAKKL